LTAGNVITKKRARLSPDIVFLYRTWEAVEAFRAKQSQGPQKKNDGVIIVE
jgi:hypothetical protein